MRITTGRVKTSPMPLRIQTFDPGPYATNCYVVASDADGSPPGGPGDSNIARPCWIIDAGFEPDAMIHAIREQRLTPHALVLTHAHIDHIAGVRDVLKAFPGTPVWIHEAERDWLGDPELNLSIFTGQPVTAPGPDRTLTHGEKLTLADQVFTVLHIPGHSPGGITLYNAAAKVAFVGDALFAGSIGRTDFPGCSFEELERSIRTRLYTLPDDTIVLPGHGPRTTIGKEKNSNPFVRGLESKGTRTG